jgi:hypothetical protein
MSTITQVVVVRVVFQFGVADLSKRFETYSYCARAVGDVSKHLERECDALPSADTQRHDAALQTVAPHRVQ